MAKREIPLKNYVYLVLIVFLTLGILYYLYLWSIEYKKEVTSDSVISSSLQLINYNEVEDYIVENDNVCLYISNKNIELKDFEKSLKHLIEKYNLERKILYLDITNNISNDEYNIRDTYLTGVPKFIYFIDGKLVSSYDIDYNNYKIANIENYLRSIGVIEND